MTRRASGAGYLPVGLLGGVRITVTAGATQPSVDALTHIPWKRTFMEESACDGSNNVATSRACDGALPPFVVAAD
jgi:hypothetical protein